MGADKEKPQLTEKANIFPIWDMISHVWSTGFLLPDLPTKSWGEGRREG